MRISETRTVGGVSITRTVEVDDESLLDDSWVRIWITELIGKEWHANRDEKVKVVA